MEFQSLQFGVKKKNAVLQAATSTALVHFGQQLQTAAVPKIDSLQAGPNKAIALFGTKNTTQTSPIFAGDTQKSSDPMNMALRKGARDPDDKTCLGGG